MTDVAVAALAARTGTAVVSLMRAENWPEFQTDLARWFGGADQRQVERIAERLGKERDEWLVSMPSRKYALRARFREAWATRVSDRLDDLDGAERATAVRELQALLDGLLPPEPEAAPEAPAPEAAPVHAQDDALAVGGDLSVTASGERSLAAAVIRGDVHAGAPPSPVPPSGAGRVPGLSDPANEPTPHATSPGEQPPPHDTGRTVRIEARGNGVAFGEAHTVNYHQSAAPSAPVPLPHRMGRVPALAAHFLDREIPELESPDLGDPPHVLTGTAGVGKTQLAVRFAEQAWDDDDIHLLLWVDASSRESVVAAYAHAAEDLYGRAYPDPAAGALAFLNWLRPAGGKHDHPWLIVLDGVADPADLTDLWPPSTTGGYVLVTSRRRDFTRAGAAAKPVVVAVPDFTRPEIRTYLQNALDHRELGSPDTDPVAQRIAELGGVGTFIWSAAREIARFGLPLDTYLDRLGGGAPAETALYAAQWQSIEAAQRLAPAGLALPVLHLLVTVGRMPEQVLFAPPVLELLNHTPDKAPEAAPDVSAADVRATLRLLHSMSLLDESRAGAYRVAAAARGTQRAVAAATDAGTVRTVVGALADALALVWPEAEPDEAAAQLLWEAVSDLLKAQSGAPLVSSDGIHPVVFRAGNSRGEWGWEDEAEEFFDGLGEYAEGVLDDQQPDVLKAAAFAGRWRAARGADGAAVALLAEVLADQRETLAADHPDVLTTRHHLAWSRLATEGWDAVQPRAELTAVLRDRGTVLGPQHPDTLRTLSALVEAMVLRPAQVAGEDVVAVAIGLFGLPAAAGTLETEPDVVAFAAQLVTLLGRHLGPAHLATLDARRLLALARLRAGDAEAALEEATEAGVAVRQAFGPEHPLTLRCRALVGLAQYRTGAEADAYSTLDAVCNDQLTLLGPDHPDALQTSAYLLPVDGDTWPSRDDRGRLLTECATLLADVERVFGPDHTRTLAVLDDIGHAQGTFGLHIAAVATFADLAGRCARLRGPDHPETLRARHRLAWHRAAAGDWLGGVAELAPVIGDFNRILGRDHQTTRTARLHLAWFRGEAGDVLGATTDLTLLLADHAQTPGADSPAASAARDALAHWQSRG